MEGVGGRAKEDKMTVDVTIKLNELLQRMPTGLTEAQIKARLAEAGISAHHAGAVVDALGDAKDAATPKAEAGVEFLGVGKKGMGVSPKASFNPSLSAVEELYK
ncbi:MAG TPA: hypothetical protein DIV86_05845 [Alphaproteobacteria bacterium]|nr:hypothetical protein [Alphaproteobacteria bacterium]